MGKRKLGIVTEASSRKARRKEQRQLKKKKRFVAHSHHAAEEDTGVEEARTRPRSRSRGESGDSFDGGATTSRSRVTETEASKGSKNNKKKNKKRKTSSADEDNVADPYAHLDPVVAAALRAEDAEINDLESRLGVGAGPEERKRLNKEYAKLEGYGDDFGEFLFGLDDLATRLGGGGGDADTSDGANENESDDHHDPELLVSDNKSNIETSQPKEPEKKKRNKKSRATSSASGGDLYADMDPETAAALQAEDAEIESLEEKLGLASGKKGRKKLNKEYAKLEGYGDDFGDFLTGLDGMVSRLGSEGGKYASDSDEEKVHYNSASSEGYDGGSTASSSHGEEVVPMKEAAVSDEEEEFDDAFHARLSASKIHGEDDEHYSSSGSERIGSAPSNSASDSDDDSDDNSDDDENSDANSSESSEDAKDPTNAPDHDAKFTYRPSSGEDIYGNITSSGLDSAAKPSKYVPPHLREKVAASSAEKNEKEAAEKENGGTEQKKDDDDPHRQESLLIIKRSLNNVLNRLSDNMLESVSKSIAALYRSYPTHDVNECFLSNIKNACVAQNIVMSGLIPIYTACASGVHVQTGDDIQLGGYLLEHIVLDLLNELDEARKEARSQSSDGGNDDMGGDESVVSNRRASNLVLILSYLYNYNIVHCSLMYDIIRELIENFSEMDVEVLLLMLGHCGYQLRSDDPTALRDIVLLVQDRARRLLDDEKDGESRRVANSSRVQYMVSAMTDLKNNKRRKKEEAIGLKTAGYRRSIGRIKSISSKSIGRSSEACMRIKLQDIKDIESKGRWWKVGAKWRGNQFHDGNVEAGDGAGASTSSVMRKKSAAEREEDALLVIASKYRMNTDLRRSIFCIIMGSTDCEDAFEKLVRGGMLKGKAERDVIRVLAECCSQEKSYNPFYAHLATRICEYQPSCHFTFRLTYWDAFKQFDGMKPRKAANLAKLLAHLLTNERGLNLNVLRVIDIDSSGMPEQAVIFLMVLFTTLFESFDDPLQVKGIFERAVSSRKKRKRSASVGDDDELDDDDGGEGMKESISLFLLQYLKRSPKNTKKSTFRANFKAALKACETDGF
mmetsp:Transcript_3072/g.6673  ORF Transcript_3072/g.6673 Transcript_3072/m.6673 type:complete len:1074 (+) Transcript_3072:35-3256(+)